MLAFGPDGCLFIGAGDGGNGNDEGTGHAPGGNGQSLDTPLAKILRIDVDDPMSAAPGNMGGGNKHIWDYGIRNPWRFSFDRETGDLYIGDVGQGAVEEIDVEVKGDGNHNYGWPIGEGTKCRGGGDPSGCDLSGLTPPVDDYPHVMDQIDCVVGGYVYRGSKIPSLKSWYVYGDNGPNGLIRTFVWDGEKRCKDTIDLSTRDGIHLDSDIVSFGEDGKGELYVMSHTGVYQIEPK
jgi:glucose/arabinose dehydrogenase